MIRFVCLLSAFLFLQIFSVGAYNFPDKNNSDGGGGAGGPKAAGCAPSNGKVFMDFNNVRALIEVGGSMWQDRGAGAPSYEVPKGSGKNVLFAGSLWMGGTDVNGQLKLAALLFRLDGNDFWAGPLSKTDGTGNYEFGDPGDASLRRDYGNAEIIPEQCAKYDQMYSISRAEVQKYVNWWECTNGIIEADFCDTISISTTLRNKINNWPAHGNKSLDQDYYLAPFYDNPNSPNGTNGEYLPEVDGDYPWYDFTGEVTDNCREDRRITLFGDQTYWWIFNDKGNVHTETGADPIGMEIRAQAFAFATNDEINNMTFYNYELINRSTQRLQDTYFGQYADTDVGGSEDDYVGCDVTRGLGYAYNGDLDDQPTNGNPGYGSIPPAVGIDFFEGPYQDDDGVDNPVGIGKNQALNGIGFGDGIVDNERYGMRKFLYFNRDDTGPSYTAGPDNASDYYNYLRGIWKDGTVNLYGGTGHQSTAPTNLEADFMFPNESDSLNWGTDGQDPGFPWSEETDNNQSGDRRFVQSAGPFVLDPGAVNNITVGVVFGQAEGGLRASVSAMKSADTKAQALFEACFQIVEPPNAPNLSARELNEKAVLYIQNPANSNNSDENYFVRDRVNIITPDSLIAAGKPYDDTFRFEGYQIYQLKNQSVAVQDIDDDSKARLVTTVDKDNGIDRAVNYILDQQLGVTIPYVRFEGPDNGLKHSFEVTEDLFASGSNRSLVNHKKYYYLAVAFAYNEYKEYDPNDPQKLNGQKQPYLRSRLSASGGEVRPITVIPHKPAPENSGMKLNSDYGDGPQLTRIDGEGNGGNELAFTTATENEIVANGFSANPTYLGGQGPVDIKVVDPFNVKRGDYEFRLKSYQSNQPNPGSLGDVDTADWYLVRNYTDSMSNLQTDTVFSDTSINVGVEKLILDWGISVSIKQTQYGGNFLQGTATTELLSSSKTYEDSSKIWLDGVEDEDIYYPTNWIRSGTYAPQASECVPALCLRNPCNYGDLDGDDDKRYDGMIDGTFAPFKLVGYSRESPSSLPKPNQANCPPGMAMHIPNFFASISAARKKAQIASMQSVDIVFTEDKSKWTRCPVIEMGEEKVLNADQVKKMHLRSGKSVNKEGAPDGSGTGMGWFPGYAISMETGERLNMAFGENSALPNDNGRDMQWNPTSKMQNNTQSPIFGGMHYVYVFNVGVDGTPMPAYDQGVYLKQQLEAESATSYREAWSNCMYVGTPMLAPNTELLSNDVRVSIRLAKKYENNSVTGTNAGDPMYNFTIGDDLAPVFNIGDTLQSELNDFRAVPNPYYGYSQYETSKLDTRIKIVDIPQKCTVSIFDVSGSLVRTLEKDDPLTSVEWDIKNDNGIPVAGGMYIIHVKTPDGKVGITKWFGAMRPPNLENF